MVRRVVACRRRVQRDPKIEPGLGPVRLGCGQHMAPAKKRRAECQFTAETKRVRLSQDTRSTYDNTHTQYTKADKKGSQQPGRFFVRTRCKG